MIVLRQRGEEVLSRSVTLAEYEELEIEVRTGAAVSTCPGVSLDGTSIGSPAVAAHSNGLLWRWTFRSESWCGRAVLTITSDQAPVDVEIRAVPSGSKYSGDEYDMMLARVLQYGEGLVWGLSPGQDKGSEGDVPSLGATHPAVIDQHLHALEVQLVRVLADPVLAQHRSEMLRPFRPPRTVTPGEVRWLASRPDRLDRIRHGDHRVVMPQRRREDTYAHPANRYVVTLLRRLRAAFRRTADALLSHARKALLGDLEKARAHHLARRTTAAAAKIAVALNHPVLVGLEAGELTESVTLVFADHPAYACFARLARRMLQPGVRLDQAGDLSASLKRSWDLFEIYCLFRLTEVLQAALGPGWTIWQAPLRHHVLTAPEEGVFWSATRADGLRYQLLYQQYFGHGDSGPGTVTTGRRPDFVLTVHNGGVLVSWTLLDAKYRTASASIADAMESMHVYRDSLRWNTAGENMPARGGYLLVPQVASSCAQFANAEFLRQNRFGLLNIGNDIALQNCLQVNAA